MKIQHIRLNVFQHILVVDGVRGPLCNAAPTTHPSGVIAYPDESYNIPQLLRGRVFIEAHDVEIEKIDDSACDESTKAYKEWVEVQKTCVEVKLARYGEEAQP